VLFASAPMVLLFALLAWIITVPRTLSTAPSRS